MKGSKNNKPSQYGRLSQSILNGVIGDYLHESNNPLAIQMGFYHQFNRVNLESELTEQLPDLNVTNKVVVLVHGLTNLETVWDFLKPNETCDSQSSPLHTKENYGTKLQSDFGYTPLFLRYNTGLPIEANGEQFSELLDQLIKNYPIDIDELVILGFSMGGLLLRLAQKNAIDQDKAWLNVLSKCIYIGTPHEGSPLEKFGHITGEIVRNIPLDYINHWADWIDIRSQGIKDLKLGLKPLADAQEQEECESFHTGSEHYFISGSVSSDIDNMPGKIFGDTLVRQGSAIPGSKPLESHFVQFESLPHVPLAHSEQVYKQIVEWLTEDTRNIKLKCLPKRLTSNTNTKTEVSNQDKIIGVLSLASDTTNKVIETSEVMHKSIAKVPFGILQKIPVIKEFSAPVESTHNEISNMVFKSLKAGGKKASRLTKQTKK